MITIVSERERIGVFWRRNKSLWHFLHKWSKIGFFTTSDMSLKELSMLLTRRCVTAESLLNKVFLGHECVKAKMEWIHGPREAAEARAGLKTSISLLNFIPNGASSAKQQRACIT